MVLVNPPIQDGRVRKAFDDFPAAARAALFKLRELIFETAEVLPSVGVLEETLKWGEPAYLTSETKSGTTIRLGVPKQGGVAVYVHCQTTIISDFQSIFPDDFDYEGNRAVRLQVGEALPLEKLRLLISSALTYHLK